MNVRAWHAVGDFQDRDRHRQLEAARAGAAGIDEQYSIAQIDRWPVRMAGNDDLHAGCGGVDRERMNVMQYIQGYAAEFNRSRFRNRCRPVAAVIVAANRTDRCDLRELFEDSRVPDIARMDDVRHPAQCLQRLRTQQAVRI